MQEEDLEGFYLRKVLLYVQVWNNEWSDGREVGEISVVFEVEKYSSWWAVDDGDWVAVIRVVKDPSCPSYLNHASWTHSKAPGPQGHEPERERDAGQISWYSW